ncbi:MAG: Spy/CpxP family protein refolding chaperone [Terriglobales bacterium]
MFSSRSWKQKFSYVAMYSLLTLLLGVMCFGQQPSPGGPDGPPQDPGRPGRRGMRGPGGPGGPLRLGPPGRWWDDPEFIKKLGLSDDQQKKMDDIFNSARLKLIDLSASVQKEEAIMEPLVAADPPDENKLLAQIDRVAQARAELEKANARMLLGIRSQLTHEQWLKLKAERPPMHGSMRGMGDDRGGPGRDDGPPPGNAQP